MKDGWKACELDPGQPQKLNLATVHHISHCIIWMEELPRMRRRNLGFTSRPECHAVPRLSASLGHSLSRATAASRGEYRDCCHPSRLMASTTPVRSRNGHV